MKHTEKERSHQCTTCSKSFFTISTLKKHIESHRAKDMPCEFCGKLFSCMNNLRTHLYYHQDPKFECDFEGCGKKFFMRKLLRAHMNVIQLHSLNWYLSSFNIDFFDFRFIGAKRILHAAIAKNVIFSSRI